MIPLFDPAEMQDFIIGAPRPGPGEPMPDNIDFSGANPAIQFPRNFHVIAGKGLDWTPDGKYFVGRSWQDYAPGMFQPDRCRVLSMQMSDAPQNKPQNVIRTIGGVPGRPYGANLWHVFDAPLKWTDGKTLRAVWEFMPSDEIPASLFANCEIRGTLDFAPHQEAYELCTVNLYPTWFNVRWWHDGRDGQGIDGRELVKFPFVMRYGEWHRLVVVLTPTAQPNTWQFRVKLLNRFQRVVWDCPADRLPQHGVAADRLFFGDEHDAPRDETGGVWYWRKVGAWAV